MGKDLIGDRFFVARGLTLGLTFSCFYRFGVCYLPFRSPDKRNFGTDFFYLLLERILCDASGISSVVTSEPLN